MPKRKAANRKKQGNADGAKKPHTAVVAAMADGSDPLDAAIAHAQLTQRMAVHTLKLVDTIQKKEGSFSQRMQSVVDRLQAEADRSDSLIDLSLVVEGEKVTRCIRTDNQAAP